MNKQQKHALGAIVARIGLGVAMMSIFSQQAVGYQAFTNLPGSRAAGMAGVFTAHADDATAIWYNPAGLSQPGLATNEASLDWGDLAGLDDNGEFTSGDAAIKFAGIHTTRLPNWHNWIQRPALGIALLRPYSLDIDITEPRGSLDPSPFGRVELDYYQASLQASIGIGEHAAIGATYDFIWSEVDCLSYSPCASNGPSGSGFSLALSYRWPVSDLVQISGALVTRTKASMDYNEVSTTGIGRQLDDYAPDRPASIRAGINIRTTTAWGVTNANVDLAQINWEDSVGDNIEFNSRGMDYTHLGVGGEVILPMALASVALRGGYASETPDDEHRFAKIDRWTIGAGLAFNARHFLDGALEWRNLEEGSSSESTQLFSVSYSLQF